MFITYEAAKAMRPKVRAAKIQRIYDALEGMSDPYPAKLLEALDNLLCADGSCDHYTCTQGAGLYEWEQTEARRGF